MKKRFLPFSLLLVIVILGQSLMAGQGGHYVPREKDNSSAEAFISSMRVNQHTGMIDPAWLIAASKQVKSNTNRGGDQVYWKSMGPDNIGGRTTSVVFNNANPNEVYIGSMGGGVFYTWNNGISWHQVGENLMVSCMAQAEDGTIYVGTGDSKIVYNHGSSSDANVNYFTYDNIFIGSGIYTIKDREMKPVDGTAPDGNNPEDGWGFINDLAFDGDNLVVATQEGLKYRENGEWKFAQHVDAEGNKVDLVGNAIKVKVGSDEEHTVVASVDGKIYIGPIDNMICKSGPKTNNEVLDPNGNIDSIATAAGLLEFAVAIDGTNSVIYAMTIDAKGKFYKLYVSEDKGEIWRIILQAPASGYLFFGAKDNERGLYNHGLEVDPEDVDKIYLLGKDLWMLERPSHQPNGYYLATQISASTSSLLPYSNDPNYLHMGLNAMVFDPRPAKQIAYVGSDGGIFKATKSSDGSFAFANCNRGYISTRCLSVAPSGTITRTIGGVLDYGPVLIQGDENTNNLGTGDMLCPGETVAGGMYGVYSESYTPGPCAVSLIQPNAIFLTTRNGGLYRSDDAGANYDFANFTTNPDPDEVVLSISFEGYRLPIAYWESFNDEYCAEGVWFKCKKDLKAGDVIQVKSSNGGYPVDYTLTQDMHYDTVNPALSDSVLVPDIISTKLAVLSKLSASKYKIYYTLDAIHFDKRCDWYNIGEVGGYPTCMTFSADGDNIFVGTRNKGLYRISNLRHAVDSASCTSSDTLHFAPVVTAVPLPTTTQYVTSISVFTDDPNKIVVTLGNYGNENYILYSEDALSDEPTFVEKQGDLLLMPVYSSVYTSTYDGANQGHVLVGTEHGVYRTTNIAAAEPHWELASDNMGDVPVMELKQQVVHQETHYYTSVVDTIVTVVPYVGTNNQGVIYAATYGRGLFRCETYRQHSGYSVPETPVVTVQNNKVNMYPNPVRDEAKVRFQLNENANVNYQVYDMSGRLVKTESLGFFTEGIEHEVNVTMNGLAKGAYVLRLNAGSQSSSVKFMVF